MSSNDYVANVVAANPKLFEADTIKIKSDVFLMQLRFAFNAGKESGEAEKSEVGRALGKIGSYENAPPKKKNAWDKLKEKLDL